MASPMVAVFFVNNSCPVMCILLLYATIIGEFYLIKVLLPLNETLFELINVKTATVE